MTILVLLAVQEEQHMEMHSYFLSDGAFVCRQCKICKVMFYMLFKSWRRALFQVIVACLGQTNYFFSSVKSRLVKISNLTLYHTIPIFNTSRKESFLKHCGKKRK